MVIPKLSSNHFKTIVIRS